MLEQVYKEKYKPIVLDLYKKHIDIVEFVLTRSRKYSCLVRDHERDDYRQQIFLSLWSKYHYYLNAIEKYGDFDFRAWFYMEARAELLRYAAKLRKVWVVKLDRLYGPERIIFTDEIEKLLVIDDPYSEEHIQMLYKAISDLPSEDKKVIQIVLDETPLTTASTQDGFYSDYYGTRFRKIKDWLRENKDMYWEDMRVFAQSKDISYLGTPEPVLQIDFNGNIVHEFPSAASTENFGFSQTLVLRVVKGKFHHHLGFIWLLKKDLHLLDERVKYARRRKFKHANGRAIEQRTIDGELVKKYPSTAAARKEGFDAHYAINGCNGIYKGYHWQYAENDDPLELSGN